MVNYVSKLVGLFIHVVEILHLVKLKTVKIVKLLFTVRCSLNYVASQKYEGCILNHCCHLPQTKS